MHAFLVLFVRAISPSPMHHETCVKCGDRLLHVSYVLSPLFKTENLQRKSCVKQRDEATRQRKFQTTDRVRRIC